jgi:hypothetical protein
MTLPDASAFRLTAAMFLLFVSTAGAATATQGLLCNNRPPIGKPWTNISQSRSTGEIELIEQFDMSRLWMGAIFTRT